MKHIIGEYACSPEKDNFCYERGNAMKPATVAGYSKQMGYSDSYSISYQT
jgi:hypothetical protein